MPSWWRRLALTAHILSSVGWMGALLVYLIVAVAAMMDASGPMIPAIWPIFELMGDRALVPLAAASLVTGVIMGMSTKWGLFRHYWVIFKLVLTTTAAAVLLKHMDLVGAVTRIARRDPAHPALFGAVPGEIVHAAGGLLVPLTALILSVYKPRGITAYGQRRLREDKDG